MLQSDIKKISHCENVPLLEFSVSEVKMNSAAVLYERANYKHTAVLLW